MAKNTTLKQLFISNNNISPAGCKAIGGMLQKNRGLEELSIGMNKLGSDVTEFCKAFASNPVIKIVRFGDNGMSEEAIEKIIEAGKNRKGEPIEVYVTRGAWGEAQKAKADAKAAADLAAGIVPPAPEPSGKKGK